MGLISKPGRKGKPFRMIFDQDWMQKGDILAPAVDCPSLFKDNSDCSGAWKIQVLTKPRKKNSQWYHKVIRFLTLGKLCKEGWFYQAKVVLCSE